jgi:signal transduction histidine kinase
VAPLIDRLITTLSRTPHGERLAWSSSVPATLEVAIDADDLAELLGNLLDNAAKWADETVEVTAEATAGRACIEIEDDGPGVADHDRARLGTRFVRLDATRPGHGIGLAIARDIAEAYGGAISFGVAASGGLKVSLEVPLAQAATGQASRR